MGNLKEIMLFGTHLKISQHGTTVHSNCSSKMSHVVAEMNSKIFWNQGYVS
jgi:hypothetical protein